LVLGRELVLRRARGYAPLPVQCEKSVSNILAVGGHLKNTIALTVDHNVFLSQHIGDLENREALEAFKRVIESFCRLYRASPDRIVADLHPDYLSTKYARECGIPLISIQHHYAHVASCMAENQLDGAVLGVSWDGTGYGLDGTVWGGEFLLTDETSFTRVASFRRFRLPGGSPSTKEPRRTAIGMLYEILGNALFDQKDLPPVQSFTDSDLSILAKMLQKGINSPWTTSVGRIFDAVASLSGLRQLIKFEGQAAMELEFAIGSENTDKSYPFAISQKTEAQGARPEMVIEWEDAIRAILQDCRDSIPLASISKKFHNMLVEVIVAVARRISGKRVVLSGGCFQNKALLERAVRRLEEEGFQPYWHQRVPPNDGGIALGQIYGASRLLKQELKAEFRS
jgi:hydrogenase maturation protein HypF